MRMIQVSSNINFVILQYVYGDRVSIRLRTCRRVARGVVEATELNRRTRWNYRFFNAVVKYIIII